MTNESENYLTKANPSVEDWITYNQPFFDSAKLHTADEGASLGSGVLDMELDELSTGRVEWAFLTDFDLHAIQQGIEPIEYFDEVCSRVGSLGKFALKLIKTDDESVAIAIGVDGVEDYPSIVRDSSL